MYKERFLKAAKTKKKRSGKGWYCISLRKWPADLWCLWGVNILLASKKVHIIIIIVIDIVINIVIIVIIIVILSFLVHRTF